MVQCSGSTIYNSSKSSDNWFVRDNDTDLTCLYLRVIARNKIATILPTAQRVLNTYRAISLISLSILTGLRLATGLLPPDKIEPFHKITGEDDFCRFYCVND